jgi:hypothetical protein
MRHPKSTLSFFLAVILPIFFAASRALGEPTQLERVYRPYNELLRTYVVSESTFEGGREHVKTRVRYAALKHDQRWTALIENLAKVDSVWVRLAEPNDRLAFWINTYNALIIDTVVKHYPIAPTGNHPKPSILAIPKAWELPHTIAGRSYTLTEIERILEGLGDGRVWFLVCPAAAGGPNLRPYAITPSNVEQELESACGTFCNDERWVKIDFSVAELRVSSYLQDHIANLADPVRTYVAGATNYPMSMQPLVDTILRRLPSEKREFIREKKPAVVFFDMDWSLNDAQ